MRVILIFIIKKNIWISNLTIWHFMIPLWTILLSIALFFPIRQLIWVLYVRRKQKKQNLVSEEEKKILKKESNVHFNFFIYSF